MRSYTPRELRNAVLLAVVLTALGTVALLDPSCQPRTDTSHSGPSHSLSP
jgi:hypothetical protein